MGKGYAEIAGAAAFIEINAKDLAASERHLVEGENRAGRSVWGCYTQTVGLSWEDGFFVLQAAFGLALALYGKARIGEVVAHGGAVLDGEDNEKDIVPHQKIIAEDLDSVVFCADMVEFFGHFGNGLKGMR